MAPPLKPAGGPPFKPIAGRDVLIGLGAAALIFAVSLSFLGLLLENNPSGPRRQLITIVAFAANAAAFGGATWILLVRSPGYSWADLGVRPPDPVWLKRAIYYGIALVPAAFLLAAGIRALTGVEAPKSIGIAPKDMSWIAAGTILLYAGILVPIFEEIFFRGVLFGWLRQKMSLPAAIMLSAGIFAVFHLRIDVMGPAFLTGALLAWMYARSGSVLPCILLHQVFNTIQLVLVYGLIALSPGN